MLMVSGISCQKKKYPEQTVYENSPVFYSTLTVNNTPVTIEAGKNSYYMYSSYNFDSSNVYNLIGDLIYTVVYRPSSYYFLH